MVGSIAWHDASASGVVVAGRLENIARELRELLLVLRDQIVPALREQHELIMLLEQDRNELFQRVTQLEAKAG